MASKTFLVACQQYFGRKPGQTLQQFAEEAKKLTAEDRAELAPLLAAELGYEVTF